MICLIAVEYHSNNLFHGDIKPHNIFLDHAGYAIEITSDIGSLLYLGELNEK